MTAVKPRLQYFPVRGRGEPIKLNLAAANVEWEFVDLTCDKGPAVIKDLEAFPFGQAPRYIDDSVDMVQSNAICRHLGRKHGMYGANLAEAAKIDQILDGVEDQRSKYLGLIYKDELADGPKKAYFETHVDPASAQSRNWGAHFAFLSNLLKKNEGGRGFMVGNQLSIADIAVLDLVDLHLRLDFAGQFKQLHPELTAHHSRIAAVPGIKAYLESPLRVAKVNGNNLG
ncbi:hypothetical protein N2152v2_010435 [Parachlorella kessleri]